MIVVVLFLSFFNKKKPYLNTTFLTNYNYYYEWGYSRMSRIPL